MNSLVVRTDRGNLTVAAADWLEGALAQVDQVDRDAEEEGYPAIGELAKRNAKHVLVMSARSSIEPDVYPSMDGEVALFFRSPKAQAGLLILLDNSGGAGCFWSTGGKSQRKHHEDALKLPPDFLSTQLRALGGTPKTSEAALTGARPPSKVGRSPRTGVNP